MDERRKLWLQRRRRISEIIEVGTSGDWISRGYDIFSTLILITNLIVTILYTFDEGYVKDEILLPVDEGYLTLDMGKTSAAILRYTRY